MLCCPLHILLLQLLPLLLPRSSPATDAAHLAILGLSHGLLHLLADAVIQLLHLHSTTKIHSAFCPMRGWRCVTAAASSSTHWLAQQLAQAGCHGSQPELVLRARLRATLQNKKRDWSGAGSNEGPQQENCRARLGLIHPGTHQVGGEQHLGAVVQQVLEGWHGSPDAGVVGDLLLLQGHQAWDISAPAGLAESQARILHASAARDGLTLSRGTFRSAKAKSSSDR